MVRVHAALLERTLKQKNGFTLVEIITALTLMLVFLATANTLFVSGINAYHQNRDRAEVAENLRVGMNRLSREMRQAVEFGQFTPDNAGRVAFKNAGGSTISYHISTSGDYESAWQLIRAIDGHGNNPVARYVNRLTVEPPDADEHNRVITVTLAGAKGDSGMMQVITTVRLRQ